MTAREQLPERMLRATAPAGVLLVNIRTLRALEPLLPPEVRSEFLIRVGASGFPELWTTDAARTLFAAEAAIDPAVRSAALATLRDGMWRMCDELAAFNAPDRLLDWYGLLIVNRTEASQAEFSARGDAYEQRKQEIIDAAATRVRRLMAESLIAVVADGPPLAFEVSKTSPRFHDPGLLAPILSESGLERFFAGVGVEDDQASLIRMAYIDLVAEYRVQTKPMLDYAESNRNERDAALRAGRNPYDVQWDVRPQFEWKERRVEVESNFEDAVGALLDSPKAKGEWRLAMAEARTSYFAGVQNQLPLAVALPDLWRALRDHAARTEDPACDDLIVRTLLAVDEEIRTFDRISNELWASQPGSPEPASQVRAAWEAMESNIRGALEPLIDLTPELRQRIDRILDQAEYPELYQPSPADLLITCLRDDVRLSPDQREAVAAMEASYRAACRPHEQTIRAWHEDMKDPAFVEESRAQSSAWWMANRDRSEDDPYVIYRTPETAAWAKIYELSARKCRQLKLLFQPDELAALPPHVRLLMDYE